MAEQEPVHHYKIRIRRPRRIGHQGPPQLDGRLQPVHSVTPNSAFST